MTLSYPNAVAVAEIAFYSPAFLVGVFLMVRHGWRKTSGWLFIAAFAVARLLGASFQLATINSPDNLNLYIGTATLANIGLSPLLLATLGLIGRVRFSIQKSRSIIIPSQLIHLDEIITIVALILSIVGATSLPDSVFTGGAHLEMPTTMTVSVILFIVAFSGLTLFTLVLWFYIKDVEQGERRLLVAITLSLPFLLVRILYTSLAILRQLPEFSWISGSTTIFLCMAIIMEAAVVVIYEATGLTLRQLSPDDVARIHADRQRDGHERMNSEARSDSEGGLGRELAKLGKKTLIGRLITAVGEK